MRSGACGASVAAMALALASACGPARAPAGGRGVVWRYEVAVVERGRDGERELAVEAWLPPGSLPRLRVRDAALPFVRDVAIERPGGWRAVAGRGGGLDAPECARGCHLRYRFLLRRAAEVLADAEAARAWGEVVEASPSLWLLHPERGPEGARYRFHVASAAAFVTGVFPAPGRDTYEADATDIGVAPYAAFGPLRVHLLEPVAGAAIELAVAPGAYAVGDAALAAWVTRSARTMARFFGCFPLERTAIIVVPTEGDDVRRGITMGDGGASVLLEVGTGAGPLALAGDWVLPHEMAHLAIPSVPLRHHWVEEGLAVYFEPIARARAGDLAPEEVWRRFARGMPSGAPAPGDRGLDGSSSWTRTYWGGASFCLLADVEMRRRAGVHRGLDEALRGVLAAGGNVARVWDLDRLLGTADAAVGVPVLSRLHDLAGGSPWTIDLPGLFADLGVEVDAAGEVRFVEDAPLAAIRRAITERAREPAEAPAACGLRSPATALARDTVAP